MKKIQTLANAAMLSRKLQKKRKKVVFTNGTFDLLHLGHISYLQKARACGDFLWVGVNSDASVKSYKGSNRPLNPQSDRMRVLAALECVDGVVLFNSPTPIKLIEKIRPNILVKGADWPKHKIVGAQEVESWGGKVKRIRFVAGRSTTRLLKLLGAE